jgi:hypothetical protein
VAQTFIPLSKAAEPHPQERRILTRFPLPSLLPLEVSWKGRALALTRQPELENISGSGLCVCLGEGEMPPVGGTVEVKLPLRGGLFGPVRLQARCQARVVRLEQVPRRMAVEFQDIDFVRDEGMNGRGKLLGAPSTRSGSPLRSDAWPPEPMLRGFPSNKVP